MKNIVTWFTLLATVLLFAVGCQSEPSDREGKAPENNYEYEYDEEKASPASDFSYTELEDGNIAITRYKGEDANVVVPKSIEGKKVTAIRGAFYYSAVESVVLPREVSLIGVQAFINCKNLKSVMLPPNLKTIETEAFKDCTALKEIAFPNGLEKMGYMAFNGCTALEYAFIPKTVSDWDGGGNFYQSGLKKVDLEEGLTSLGHMTLAATQITEITFPKSMKTISEGVCARCEKLKKVIMPEGVEAIEDSAFYKTAITEIVIPASVKSVNDTVFESCENLKKVTFMGDAPQQFVDDEHNFMLGEGGGEYTVYYQKNAKGFSTPRWCGYKAAPVGSEPDALVEGDFEYAVNADGTVTLVSYEGDATVVVVPDKIAGKTLSIIGSKAFAYEDSIVSVKLPDTVTEIGFGAFAQCWAVTSVNLPENLQMIGDYAFSSCHDLTEINLPASLRKIGKDAFSGCQKVKYLRIPATVAEIGEGAFGGLGYTNNGWSKGEFELVLEEGIEVIGNWFYATSMESVVLPSTVKRIEEGAFRDCRYLTSITLNEGLTYIGDYAFGTCVELSEIVIPSTVTDVSVLAFSNCSDLEAVKFEGNAPNAFWKDIPEDNWWKPEFVVYRHEDATGFIGKNFREFEVKVW